MKHSVSVVAGAEVRVERVPALGDWNIRATHIATGRSAVGVATTNPADDLGVGRRPRLDGLRDEVVGPEKGGLQVADAERGSEQGVVTKASPRSESETVARFTDLLKEKGVRLFAVIDQAAEARQVGLDFRDTILVLFGNPKAGTPVMVASPLAALDLPLKVVVWADGSQTNVSYPATSALAARYHLSPELAANLAALDGLTDALVGS